MVGHEGGPAALGQDLRLLDPVFLLDATFESERRADLLHVERAEPRDLLEAVDAQPGEALARIRIDAPDLGQIIGGKWW
jgi:hypothetical protein